MQYKQASRYYSEWEPDYWRFLYLTDPSHILPSHPHPQLGWLQKANPVSLYHNDAPQVGNRRPILLYGDSFSACIDSVRCFEDFLNSDSTFTDQNYLLNYGVGGYGVCQSSLLCRATAPHYQRPLVVFGVLTSDLDRTVLPERCGQKPYYDVQDGELQLKGYPIDPDPRHHYDQLDLASTMYVPRLFLLGGFNPLPRSWTEKYLGYDKVFQHIQTVNGLLIKQLAAELKALDLEFVFLVFHHQDESGATEMDPDWRDKLLRKTFEENAIPYVMSKDIIRAHWQAHPENRFEDYIIPGEGHPTSLSNGLVAARIRDIALSSTRQGRIVPDTTDPELYETQIARRRNEILRDSSTLNATKQKAIHNQIELATQIEQEALFLMNLKPRFAPDGVFEGRWRTQRLP